MHKRVLQGLAIGLAAAAAAGLLWAAGWLDPLEARTWDWRVTALARFEKPSDKIGLVFLDQTSLDWGSRENNLSWPWPREVYAPIINLAVRAGARSIAFDVLFTEPSKYGVEDDEALGAAIRNSGCFVNSCFLSREAGSFTNWPALWRPASIRINDHDGLLEKAEMRLPRAVFPIPEIATNAAAIGAVSFNPDPDGVYRRVRLFDVFDGKVVPSLGLASYLMAQPVRTLTIRSGWLRIGNARVPLDRHGRAVLHYRGPSQTHRTVNAAAVIQAALKPGDIPVPLVEAFRDRHVLFGYTAPGLYDLRPTPVGGVYPGVEIHATVLDNLLTSEFMRDAPLGLTLALVVLLSGLAGVFTRCARNAAQTVVAFAVILPLPVVLGFLAYPRGLWVPVVVQLAGAAPALVGGLVLNYATEGRQKRFIKSAFRQYLSPTVIDELLQNPGRLRLGGELRELSIMFSDIQGFTSISEKMDPESLTAFLNEYLTIVTDIILSEGGTVDKYEGDAVIAFWNAPVPQGDHALRAVRAALRCQQKLAERRSAFRDRTGSEVLTRIGIHTGPVVVGNMGSSQRFDYTFLGDAGNLASRLEGLNKQFGTCLLISEAVRARIGDAFPSRLIARVVVVGRREPIAVFEPMFPEEYAGRREPLANFARALGLFTQGRFQDAVGIFDSLADADPAAARYAERCRRLADRPPATWDGILTMTEK
jgi:adenylate cyclase